jgi:hypothetical protein
MVFVVEIAHQSIAPSDLPRVSGRNSDRDSPPCLLLQNPMFVSELIVR